MSKKDKNIPTNTNKKNTLLDSSINAGRDAHIGDVVNIQQVVREARTITENQPSDQFVSQIKELIGKNKIKQALEKLLQYTKDRDFELHSKVIAQSGKWNELRRLDSFGIISREQAGIQHSRILYDLLEIVGSLEE